MAEAPHRRTSRRWWLNMVVAGVLLAACDFNPGLGDGRNPGRQRQPVETVTALEIDAGDVLADDPPPGRAGSR
jgi:hypothetical protein